MCRGPFSLFAALSQGGSGNGTEKLLRVVVPPVLSLSPSVVLCDIHSSVHCVCHCEKLWSVVNLPIFFWTGRFRFCCAKQISVISKSNKDLNWWLRTFAFFTHPIPLALSLIAILGLRGNSLKFNRALLSKSRINKLVSTFI